MYKTIESTYKLQTEFLNKFGGDFEEAIRKGANPSEICELFHYQSCHVCDRLDCSDNTSGLYVPWTSFKV
jgi:hypothetical protein